MRRFLDARGFVEVETPVLQPLYGGAAARPFVTHHNALDMPLYLRIADELYLKRLLVGGLERVYEIGHDFRNEGMDRTHNPEFTMLEAYQAYADYSDMMELVEGLVSGVIEHCLGSLRLERSGATLDFTPPFARVRFIDGIRERSGLDLRTASEESMRRLLRARGAAADLVADLTGGRLQDEVFKAVLEPELVQPTFVLDYPKALSPLAKEHRVRPGAHGAIRAVRRRTGAGERLQRAQRPGRPAAPVRGPGAPAGRRQRGGPAVRRRLHPGAGVRDAAGGRRGARASTG